MALCPLPHHCSHLPSSTVLAVGGSGVTIGDYTLPLYSVARGKSLDTVFSFRTTAHAWNIASKQGGVTVSTAPQVSRLTAEMIAGTLILIPLLT